MNKPSRISRPAIGLAVGLAASMLLSCSGGMPEKPVAPAPDLATAYRNLAASGGKVFRLDPDKSAVRIYAFRGGHAGRLGHNHVIAAPKFVGFVSLPPTGAGDARFDLEFRLDQLEIDDPAYRAPLGKAFAGRLSQEAIAGTRDHMLGEDGLQADRFPYVRVRSLRISGEAPKLAARVEVELHGQTREMWLPLDVQGLPDKLTVTGAFVLRQSDFGVKPYSVLGGMLAVQDEVVVEFRLVGA